MVVCEGWKLILNNFISSEAGETFCEFILNNKIMQEDESLSLHKTSLPSHTLHPHITSNVSQRKHSIAESGTIKMLNQKSTTLKYELQSPSLLKNQKYTKLFDQILKDMKLIHRHISNEETSKEKQRVKQSIAKVIRLDSDEGDFNERFGIRLKARKSKSQHRKRPQNMGFTNLERQTQKRKSFFSDDRKVIRLEEECMLLEYYLKDEETQKTPLHYLKGLEQTSRHRRITPNSKDSFKLYHTHNERQYHSLKKRVHLKEQFVEKCLEFAKRNSSYRRRQNFREIEYVLKEHNQSLMDQTIIPENLNNEQQIKLQQNNQLIRLYLNYNFSSVPTRIDSSKTDSSLKQFKEDLFSAQPSFTIRQAEIDKKIDDIFQYKHQRAIHFHDFKELVLFLDQLFGKDMMKIFQKAFPHYFRRKEDQFLEEHWQEIDKYMSAHKIKFLLELVFKCFPDKMIGKKILPIKAIPAAFKVFGISEKDFKLDQLLTNYHWVQHHDAGLTFDQFYRGSILLKMKGEEWKGIESFLKKISIRRYI